MAELAPENVKLDETLDYIAELDATNIKQACEGFGTDDKALTDILCNRSKDQNKRIDAQYKKLYGQTLLDQIRAECSGDYKQFLRFLVASPEEAACDALFKAMDGMGTTERILTEIIVTSCNADLRVIQAKYQEKYDRSLLDHVCSEVSGDYRDFLVQCLKCERQEGAAPDQALAEEQVTRLIKAAKGWGCNESEFIDILGKSSIAQTDLIEATYQRREGKSLAKLIQGEMGGDLEWAMLLRLESELDAKCWLLRYAMKGMGTSEDILARVLGGSRKEDAMRIHARFDEKYSRSLTADLNSEISGNLLAGLLKWLEPPKVGYFARNSELELDPVKLADLVESAFGAVAEIDAVDLREACEGFGTDDDKLTDILCFRTKPQLARINEQYKAKFGQTLLDQVKAECSGDYKVFLQMMIAGPTEADCDALNKAMVGLGTTERVLSEIIVAATNAELVDIKTSYAAKFDRELIDHINSEISGDYRDFIIACLRGDRVETAAPDATLAAQQAAALRQAAQGWGTNESVFVDILSKASVEQTDLIEQSYEAQFGKSLKAEIKGEMGGDLEWAMLLRLESPLDAQCWLLRYAMDGMGTDEDIIARVIGGADKQRVVEIHARYDEKYSRDLMGDLRSELSGNLLKACLKWCKPPEFTDEVAQFTPLEGAVPDGTPTADPPRAVHQKPNQALMPTTAPGTAPFYITCPPGVAPGGLVAISAFGSQCSVTVPAGVVPGAQFMAVLPVPSEGIPPAPTPDAWHYVDPNGAQQGPHTAAEMKGWSAYFAPTMMVLAPGTSTWAPFSSFPQLHA